MTQIFSPRTALRSTNCKKSLDPLPFFAKKPYKYVGGNLIDESIIKLVEHEIRKATGRWTWPAGSMVPPGTTGEERVHSATIFAVPPISLSSPHFRNTIPIEASLERLPSRSPATQFAMH